MLDTSSSLAAESEPRPENESGLKYIVLLLREVVNNTKNRIRHLITVRTSTVSYCRSVLI